MFENVLKRKERDADIRTDRGLRDSQLTGIVLRRRSTEPDGGASQNSRKTLSLSHPPTASQCINVYSFQFIRHTRINKDETDLDPLISFFLFLT